KAVKNRVHLDLRPADQAAEVARLEGLGARRADVGQGTEASWVVLADPDGNEFCVLRALKPGDQTYEGVQAQSAPGGGPPGGGPRPAAGAAGPKARRRGGAAPLDGGPNPPAGRPPRGAPREAAHQPGGEPPAQRARRAPRPPPGAGPPGRGPRRYHQ